MEKKRMQILKFKDWLRFKKKLELMREQRAEIIKSWENSELLDGLKGITKPDIAKLLESEASCMLKEENFEMPKFKTKSRHTPEGILFYIDHNDSED